MGVCGQLPAGGHGPKYASHSIPAIGHSPDLLCCCFGVPGLHHKFGRSPCTAVGSKLVVHLGMSTILAAAQQHGGHHFFAPLLPWPLRGCFVPAALSHIAVVVPGGVKDSCRLLCCSLLLECKLSRLCSDSAGGIAQSSDIRPRSVWCRSVLGQHACLVCDCFLSNFGRIARAGASRRGSSSADVYICHRSPAGDECAVRASCATGRPSPTSRGWCDGVNLEHKTTLRAG
mmetsp:Transcript_129175/g.306545  ORF Transcript_129175/g.306545 Transcript_129175/m.306545 type:complete len:230 (+) Transcript_129175:299-988(+)